MTEEVPEKPALTIEVGLNDKEAFFARYGHSYNSDQKDVVNASYEFVWSKALELSYAEASEILQTASDYHNGDPNFPEDLRVRILKSLSGDKNSNELEVKTDAAMIRYYSPYPEVRSVTDPFDDTTIPVETFRCYLVAFIWTIIGSGVNSFFEPRQPAISISVSVLQIFAAMSGKFLAYVLPHWGFTFRGTRYSLNPGPWSFKEQMLATIIIGSAASYAYAFWNIMVQKIYYKNAWVGPGYQILSVLSTQLIGFGFAGILRKFVVYPVRAMWPTLLPTIALNKALVSKESKININGWTLSKYKFFWIFFGASSLYYWLPGYLFPALSNFDWMIWISPNNLKLNTITGFYGLGINPLATFDWNIINWGSPLILPFYTQLNIYTGTLIAGFILIPAVYYTNYRWAGYIPINSNQLYANNGTPYDVTQVVNEEALFDNDRYQKYSPPYYSAANLVVYGSYFALYPYSIIDQMLTNHKAVASAFIDVYKGLLDRNRSNFASHNDGFSRAMSAYKEVPDWWFLIILLISLVFGIIFVEVYPTNTPVWGIFFALGINIVFLIPITLIYSVTGFSFGLNVLMELIVGYAIPGNGIALMILKTYGYNIDGQAQNYVTDQKTAHYTKIPPRAIFRGQVVAGMFEALISIGVADWLISNIDGLCNFSIQITKEKFICPNEKTYYSSSVIWGVIGPKLVFRDLYPILKYCFLIGTLLPAPISYLKKRFPAFKTFQPILVIGGLLSYAPYSLAFYTPGIYAGFAFMYVIKRRYYAWWEKYNYVLSSALSAGLALSAIIIFFAVQYKEKDVNWWGTVGYANNIDLRDGGLPFLPIPSAGYFGYPPGQYPSRD